MPALAHVVERSLDLLSLEALHHVLPDLVGLGLDAERQHPAAGALQPVHERRIGQVVGAGVAEPLNRQLARDQLVAERGERLDVQRDRVAPQVEELDAELAVAALDLVDERLGAALAELVALVDRRDAEVAGVRAAAAGFDDHVGAIDERQRVALQIEQVPRRERHLEEARERCRARGAGRRVAVPPPRQVRDLAEPVERRSAAPAARTPSSGSPTNMPSTSAAAAAPSTRPAAVDACGPKQNIGAP